MVSSLQCEHCGNVFEAEIVDKTEFCPHCGKETRVQTPAAAAYESYAKAGAAQNSSPVTAASIREHATKMVRVAIGLLVLAALTLLITFICTVDNQAADTGSYWVTGLTVAGYFCSSAVVIYAIAQIVHIRANTLK